MKRKLIASLIVTAFVISCTAVPLAAASMEQGEFNVEGDSLSEAMQEMEEAWAEIEQNTSHGDDATLFPAILPEHSEQIVPEEQDLDPSMPVVIVDEEELESPIVLEGELDIDEDELLAPQEPRKRGNAPYLIGAGVSVVAFLGVYLYCRFKGN